MFRSRFLPLCLLVSLWLPLGAGCGNGPRLASWAPWAVQREEIQRFDPYPDNDIAPAMEGVRPPDFGQQVTEPNRSRWYQ